MKKVTESQGKAGTLGEYFSPRSTKVMGPEVQQNSRRHCTFPQETPMKPSQVPILLSHPPPRRVLPLQTPEQCKDGFSSHWHLPYPTGPANSSVFVLNSPANTDPPVSHFPKASLGPKHLAQPPGPVPSSPANICTSAYTPLPRPKERSGPQQGTVPSGPGHFCSSQLAPASLCNNISSDRPSFPSVFNSPSTESAKSFSNHTTPSHSRSDQETEFKVTPSVSGSNNDKAQRQEHFTCHQYEQMPSSEDSVPVDLNCTSQKRRREFENCNEHIKKPCPQYANSGRTQTPKPTPCNSLSTSLVSQPALKNSVLDLPPKTTDGHLSLACGQSTSSELSAVKPTQSHSTLSPKHCPKKPPLMGAKQVYITTTQNVVKLSLSSRPSEESAKDGHEENHQSHKSSVSKTPQKDSSNSPSHGSVSHSRHTGHTPVLPVKTPSRVNQVGEKKVESSTPKPISKPNLGSQSGRTAERTKTSRVRKPVVPDDIDLLFTPDPLVYVVSPTAKTAKPKTNERTVNSTTLEKVTSPATSCVSPVGASSCQSKVAKPTHAEPASAHNPPISLPTVTLKRVKLEKLQLCSENKGLKNSPSPSSGRQLKDESIKSHLKQSPLPFSTNVRTSSVEADTAASERTDSPQRAQSLPLEGQVDDGVKTEVNEEDPIDVELDLGLSIAYEIDLTQSSDSSEEEQLVSFQEMMERVTKPTPDTPEKGAFSEPSTPGPHSSGSKNQLLPSTIKSVVYKNNLDQMLKEINSNKRAKEIEAQLLTACKEDLLTLAEYEEAEENQEISSEQQEFLARYSLMSSAIREVPPGEAVFNLETFGQIFDQDTLQLRQCVVNPQGTAQKTLLWSSPAQLELHVNVGLFQTAYDNNSPCPSQVTRFLFKMMSVHNDRMVSEKLLQALCDIACSAAYQIVKNESQQFEVWVPSLADITLVLMNMGVAFVTLFPFENLQPSFTEGDVLENVFIKSESPFNRKKEVAFPEHNCCNILKYLTYCMDLCPRVYSDVELLLLLTVVGRISLETRWILHFRMEVRCLQFKIVKNIRDWDAMLPRICQALTDLTDDHHNMCLLVQLLPDNTRGRRLRRHLSMSFISKLLDGTCTYRPTEEELQLTELRPYLPRMQPSALQGLHQIDKEASVDQQAYYLCYSLLMLTNEASNFQVFPPCQKAQLIALSSELETHVKCDIRESEKCLYRSKVKDLVARIYTKWQMLLQRTRPLNGKLYDYWEPVDTFRGSQEDEEVTLNEEEEEEETTLTDENNVIMVSENEEEEKNEVMMEAEEDVKVNEGPKDIEADGAENDTSRTEEATGRRAGGSDQTVIPATPSGASEEQTDAFRRAE
ncbi:SMC5-SMC6 complex localization factor protein 2 isoform X2 [Kryptolebias marmoratus]|uniref:SMC5-SMC6 complex localization factor protein 2 isoform X2 n=1 Tax=Kryptolebias marmoratus TaxID=37003 RepID=UPI0007F8D09B|nr:SMC5-SMC6 complex localization factor protein 2 isoform X2 [Kryptolebias marmoratus]